MNAGFLDRRGSAHLAEALGDSPETVIAVHLLRRGLARASVTGEPSCFTAAIVQADELPGEPIGFGDDADALWTLLQPLLGWFCLNVAPSVAPVLARLITAATAHPTRLYGDVYHTLSQPVLPVRHETVRLLTRDDVDLLERAVPLVRGGGYESVQTLLTEGIVAATVVADEVVSSAHTGARTPGHADIGVATLSDWRGRGLATAAASLVAAHVQASGQVPVWSAGESNEASLRIARRLGFTEVSRRTYVIVDERRDMERHTT
jgi:ribosomal protein S18 acetylase RimI-like enzyme